MDIVKYYGGYQDKHYVTVKEVHYSMKKKKSQLQIMFISGDKFSVSEFPSPLMQMSSFSVPNVPVLGHVFWSYL